MLMKKLAEKSRPRGVIEAIYFEVKDKKEFLEAVESSYEATLVAQVIIEENISGYANELGVHKLARAIQRYRRGETKFFKEAS